MVSVSDCMGSRVKFGRIMWKYKKNNFRTVGINEGTTDLALAVGFLHLYLVYRSSSQLLSGKMVFPFLSAHPPPLIFLIVTVNNDNSWKGKMIA